MRTLHFVFALAVSFLLACPSRASEASVIGRWVTVDDKTGAPRSVVEIAEADGTLQGKIAKIYDEPGQSPSDLCTKCSGDLKDKPILGMKILAGLKRDGDAWDGGTILDPDSGNVYSATLGLSDSGKKLVVRGYLGISLFGRSQTWIREASAVPAK